ncbi:hypothetical protein Ahy_B08g092836 isoform B [Arachis hypogaea]|uniref:Uncharacterized protein n=1 Tax=Arachis hypogaea TaxID=3818 RepID=A0A444Y4R8_ARAHY|nr:hypothetical protein Ahy_B08g092836 isoform B [Arachis hypogaea]
MRLTLASFAFHGVVVDSPSTVAKNRPVGPNRNPPGLHKNGSSFVSFSLCFSFRKKSHNPSQKTCTPIHHRRKEWHTAAVRRTQIRHPSVYLASLVLQVFNPCSLSPIAAASSSSAFVVFVCSAALPSLFVCRSRSRLRSAVVFVRVIRRSRSLGVHCSRSLAVHHSSSHSRSSGSHVALLQTLRPTRALHLAVELLSFVAAGDSKRPRNPDHVSCCETSSPFTALHGGPASPGTAGLINFAAPLPLFHAVLPFFLGCTSIDTRPLQPSKKATDFLALQKRDIFIYNRKVLETARTPTDYH